MFYLALLLLSRRIVRAAHLVVETPDSIIDSKSEGLPKHETRLGTIELPFSDPRP